MKFKAYLLKLINGVPTEVYVLLLVAFCIGAVVSIAVKGRSKGLRNTLGLLLTEYVFLLYCSTVIFRKKAKVRDFDFTPFWSYGKPELIQENIMNAVVFIPVGILMGAAFRTMTWKKVLGIGCGISVLIEVMQLVLKRGLSEVDDVMHNTVGCMIGYGIYLMVYGLWLKIEHELHGINE